MKNIIFKNFYDAISFYEDGDFHNIDVPWYVNENISNITHKFETDKFSLPNNMKLVGSAEQSFLQIYDKLDFYKKYIAFSPCFRNEHIINDYTMEHFLKLEMFIKVKYYNDSREFYDLFSNVAFNFFSSKIPILSNNKLKIVNTNEGLDITFNNIEIGSYGIRQHDNFIWVYGTGLAEPRFSRAIASYS